MSAYSSLSGSESSNDSTCQQSSIQCHCGPVKAGPAYNPPAQHLLKLAFILLQVLTVLLNFCRHTQVPI